MSLDPNLLTNICHRDDGSFDCRCPACAAAGLDATGNHLRVYPGGRYNCAMNPGQAGMAHRSEIHALAGQSGFGMARSDPAPAPPPVVERVPNSDIPALRVPTDDELNTIATSRGWHRSLALPALRELSNRGLLSTAHWWKLRAWIVTDSTRYAWRARRLDGLGWLRSKSVTQGRQVPGWPVGVDTIADKRLVVLCEGEADLLASAVVAQAEGCDLGAIGFCAVNGAVELDTVALVAFVGKPVIVACQNDVGHGKGALIAERWLNQLHGVGAGPLRHTRFDGYLLPDGRPCKDMGDYAQTLTGATSTSLIAPFVPPPV